MALSVARAALPRIARRGASTTVKRATAAREKLVPTEAIIDAAPAGHMPAPATRPLLDLSQYPTVSGTSMRCLMKKEPTEGMWMDTAEEPLLRAGELLIRVKRAAICGTDVHIYKWDEWSQRTVPTPMITGHEYSGVVEAIGEGVRGFKVGDRVTGEGHVTCGHCRNCRGGRQHLCINTYGIGVNRPGAFADLFTLPAGNAFKLPDGITDDIASVMDPLGNAVHCALSFDVVGEDVLITGAGPIGIMAAAVCRHIGARHIVITDVNDYRLNLAKQVGATMAINVGVGENSTEVVRDAMSQLGMTEGFDVGLEMSGMSSAFKDMFDTLNHGAKVAILGIPSRPFPMDLNKVVFKGLTLKGIYGREMYETWYKMSSMLVGGLQERLQPIITHRYPLEDFQKGFDVMCAGESGKVILEF